MATLQCNNMHDVRKVILSFESLIFKSSEPVRIRKITPESGSYDCNYDTDIRRDKMSLICLLNELMGIFGKTSRSWLIQNEIEECLISVQFYRDMIFRGRCPSYESYQDKLRSYLEEDVAFLKANLTQRQYKSVICSMGDSKMPKTKKEFLVLILK
ncbi:MAG: hypothetical protein DI586_01565 [Micavibrio aeruginosavorus]|uniref:Uncharacterized protein n=1 Tax=Micavibrio aeruginosavorus TaxID=349221 RepID=A0A2W5FTG7_9BACT|nr:MAG: hypothetical protein DI586_01565 [Micavibrio aeruginosavorus]